MCHLAEFWAPDRVKLEIPNVESTWMRICIYHMSQYWYFNVLWAYRIAEVHRYKCSIASINAQHHVALPHSLPQGLVRRALREGRCAQWCHPSWEAYPSQRGEDPAGELRQVLGGASGGPRGVPSWWHTANLSLLGYEVAGGSTKNKELEVVEAW